MFERYPCFVHCYKSAQTLVLIAVEQRQTFDQSYHTIAFMINCEQPSCGQFFIRKWSFKIETTNPCDMPMASTIYRTFNLRSALLRFFFNCFGYSDFYWASRTFGIDRACTATTKFCKPLFYWYRWCRVPIVFIKLSLCFSDGFFDRKK